MNHAPLSWISVACLLMGVVCAAWWFGGDSHPDSATIPVTTTPAPDPAPQPEPVQQPAPAPDPEPAPLPAPGPAGKPVLDQKTKDAVKAALAVYRGKFLATWGTLKVLGLAVENRRYPTEPERLHAHVDYAFRKSEALRTYAFELLQLGLRIGIDANEEAGDATAKKPTDTEGTPENLAAWQGYVEAYRTLSDGLYARIEQRVTR